MGKELLIKNMEDQKDLKDQIEQVEESRDVFKNDIEFGVVFRGYAKTEVDDYISKLTVSYNAICEKCSALETENEWLRNAVTSFYKARSKSG